MDSLIIEIEKTHLFIIDQEGGVSGHFSGNNIKNKKEMYKIVSSLLPK